jgi:small subunit ribosomal protein S35
LIRTGPPRGQLPVLSNGLLYLFLFAKEGSKCVFAIFLKSSHIVFVLFQNSEQSGIPPSKYANLELMKIPNFLHLSPPHIKKHCAALKSRMPDIYVFFVCLLTVIVIVEFCTEWPKGLETDEKCYEHFPLEVITSDYVVDNLSVRDSRARLVQFKVRTTRE